MQIFEVVSRYIDRKKNTFSINIIYADAIPENTFVCLKTTDIYRDYFTDKQAAERFISDSRKGLI